MKYTYYTYEIFTPATHKNAQRQNMPFRDHFRRVLRIVGVVTKLITFAIGTHRDLFAKRVIGWVWKIRLAHFVICIILPVSHPPWRVWGENCLVCMAVTSGVGRRPHLGWSGGYTTQHKGLVILVTGWKSSRYSWSGGYTTQQKGLVILVTA